jgi:hypothetical protein
MKNSDRQNRFQQPFTPNSQNIFTLPLNGKILTGKVIVTGSLVITGGTTNGTVFADGGPAGLISRIILRGAPASNSRYPGGKIIDCSPRSLLWFASVLRKKVVLEQSGSTLASGAAGTYPIYLSIPIYFALPWLKRPVETALNADQTAYQSITVEVDTASATNCFTGTDRTWNYSGLSVQWVDDRENFAGDTYVGFQQDHTMLIPAAQQRAIDLAMPSDGSLLSMLIMAETTAQRNLADTILQILTLKENALDYMKYAQDIRQQMYDDSLIDVSQTSTGLYYLDFTNRIPGGNGLVSGGIAMSDLQNQIQVANPGGANLDDLLIHTYRCFAPQGYAPSRGKGSAKNS